MGDLWGLSPEALAGFVGTLSLWGVVAGGPAAAGGAVSLFEFAVLGSFAAVTDSEAVSVPTLDGIFAAPTRSVDRSTQPNGYAAGVRTRRR